MFSVGQLTLPMARLGRPLFCTPGFGLVGFIGVVLESILSVWSILENSDIVVAMFHAMLASVVCAVMLMSWFDERVWHQVFKCGGVVVCAASVIIMIVRQAWFASALLLVGLTSLAVGLYIQIRRRSALHRAEMASKPFTERYDKIWTKVCSTQDRDLKELSRFIGKQQGLKKMQPVYSFEQVHHMGSLLNDWYQDVVRG